MAKKTLPGYKIGFRGPPHVSALKTKSLADFPEVDFGVVGEGEQTLAELVSCDGEINPASPIPGMVCAAQKGPLIFPATGQRHRSRQSALSRL